MSSSLPNRATPVAPGRHAWTVSEGWSQGRGAFGGLVLSTLARTMREHVSDGGQRLRSLTAVIPAAVTVGEAEVTTELLRAGRNTATVDARILQQGEVRAQATGIFGSARDPELSWSDLEPPRLPHWETLDAMPHVSPPMPAFIQHVELRVAEGFVFGGGTERVVTGYTRLREPSAAPDELDLIALIDTWWGAALVTLAEPRPAATMSFAMQIVGDWEGLDRRAPLAYRGTSPASRDGYTVDFRELWSPDGRLLALNQQTLAIIK